MGESFNFFSYTADKVSFEIVDNGYKGESQTYLFFLSSFKKNFLYLKKISEAGCRVIFVVNYKFIDNVLNFHTFNLEFKKMLEHFGLVGFNLISDSKIDVCLNYFLKINKSLVGDYISENELMLFKFKDKKNNFNSKFIEKVNETIKQTLSEGEPFLNKVAYKLNMSPTFLTKRIKNDGFDFNSLVKKQKMNEALFLLEKSDLPIANIAYSLGYTETSAFSRAFKQWTGLSPISYKRKS